MTRPTLLDNVVRVVVWTFVVGALVGPLVMLVVIRSAIPDPAPWLHPPEWVTERDMFRTPPDGITAGPSPTELEAQAARLRGLTAITPPPAGEVKTLRILALRPAANDIRAGADGYIRLPLPTPTEPSEALVIVTERPIRWVVGARTAYGRVGVEGPAPFDVVGGAPGVLAGFRIGAFGASVPLRPLELPRANAPETPALCAGLRRWAEHFGLTLADTRYAVATLPSQLATGGATRASGRRLSDLCGERRFTVD